MAGFFVNFAALFAQAQKDGKTILPRTPLIPGITDTEKNIADIAAFLKGLNVKKAALLAYNPLWHDKTGKIGVADPYKTSKAMTSFADNSVLEKSKEIFAKAGIET